jgi:hypothetical protein
MGVPNCLNVVSNALFLLVGALGIRFLFRTGQWRLHFDDPRERWPWIVFFGAVAATAFGSAWYHLNPNDTTLVWDRLPMAVGFMALVAAVVAERVSLGCGLALVLPLSAAGVASVLWWSFTQSRGEGDLRFYAIVQFGCVPILGVLLAFYPARYTRNADYVISLGFYGVAKIFEAADRQIFALGHIVSGHTLKHAAAALSAWWLLRMLERRRPVVAVACRQSGEHAFS